MQTCEKNDLQREIATSIERFQYIDKNFGHENATVSFKRDHCDIFTTHHRQKLYVKVEDIAMYSKKAKDYVNCGNDIFASLEKEGIMLKR